MGGVGVVVFQVFLVREAYVGVLVGGVSLLSGVQCNVVSFEVSVGSV